MIFHCYVSLPEGNFTFKPEKGSEKMGVVKLLINNHVTTFHSKKTKCLDHCVIPQKWGHDICAADSADVWISSEFCHNGAVFDMWISRAISYRISLEVTGYMFSNCEVF